MNATSVAILSRSGWRAIADDDELLHIVSALSGVYASALCGAWVTSPSTLGREFCSKCLGQITASGGSLMTRREYERR